MERVLDQQGRWRNKVIAFRMSPEEDEVLEAKVKLSGLTKQEYIIRRLTDREITVVGNPRVYKALRDQMKHAGTGCWTGQRRGTAKPRPQTEAPGRAQRHLLMDGTSVKSAFALLSTKVTKPLPCPAPVTSTEKGRAIEKNHFRNARLRLPQP